MTKSKEQDSGFRNQDSGSFPKMVHKSATRFAETDGYSLYPVA